MLLNVNNLKVDFRTADGIVNAVRGVDFEMAEGETLGIVGESGSGKSQTILGVMGLLDTNGMVTGSAVYRDQELIGMNRKQLNRIRGRRISMIFQDPMTSLNPHLRVSTQMTEVLRFHRNMGRKEALQRSIEMLAAVHIPEAAQRIRQYPHEFSGGMRQRVMIAISLLCEPDLLIADEPTTALDVTVQAEILDLLREMKQTFNTAVILISHDLGVVAGLCDRIIVMNEGEIVETGEAEQIFYQPSHPYTRKLLSAVPRLPT